VNAFLNSVPKLDGQNYHDWKFAISMVLRGAGYWQVVFGSGDKGIVKEINPRMDNRGFTTGIDQKNKVSLW
jgi:hypothetical protein